MFKYSILFISFIVISSSFAGSYESKMNNLYNEIQSTIDLACNTTSDCDVMGVGVKPCGGYWGYIGYSKRYTQIDYLTTLVEEYNYLNNLSNIEKGAMSDCMIVTEPGIACIASQCTINR